MEENRNPVNTATVEGAPEGNPVNAPTPPPPAYGNAPQPPRPPYPQYPVYKPAPPMKVPKPLYGFNIVALIVGIFSLFGGIASLSDAIEVLYDCLSMNAGRFESLGYYVADCTTGLIIAAVCLIFGYIGYHKKENYGRSLGLAGLICGGIGLVSSLVSLVLFIVA